MNLVDMQSALKIELADDAWDAFELSRAVIEAVGDLSRFLPDEETHEFTITLDADDESWKVITFGTAVSLANKPVKWQSETVKSDDGVTTYARDTAYTMDYRAGKITAIDGGGMAEATDYKISYTIDRQVLDVSGIGDLIRILRVEYPIGETPPKYVSFSVWGTMLHLNLGESSLTENKHLLAYYQAECTAPTSLADGSFPRFLDVVILKGASAYALMSRALGLEHDAKGNIANVATVLEGISNEEISTALGKVTTVLGGVDAVLDNIGAQMDAIDAALEGFDDIWTDEGTYREAGHAYLQSGDDYINKVNVGDRVAEVYATYAQAGISLARLSESRITGKNVETNARVLAVQAYINQANALITEANSFISEATARGSYNDILVREADGYLNSVARQMELAERYLKEAVERRNEFWSILKDKSQYRNELSLVSQRQPA